MLVNLERAIKSISENIGFFQPLYEAIINSFQANAKNVKISFEIGDNKKILGYTVEDDGDGFTDENIKSFLTLWSDYKITQGALGSGRIMCLKVFDNIIIDSQTKDFSNVGQQVKIDFNRKFLANTIDEINPSKNSSKCSFTKTIFKNINEEFIRQNELEHFNSEKIKEDLFIKLLPMFTRFKNEKKQFQIKIDQDIWLDASNLTKKFDEHKFENTIFSIEVDLSKYDKNDNDLENKKIYDFELYYKLEEDKKNDLIQFYGASDRYIKDFAKGVRLERLKDGWSGIFCLTSKYFEENRVKDSRNEFVISFGQSNATKDNPITFPEINDKLMKKLDEILKKQFPEVKEELKLRKQNIIDLFPHLARYVNKIDSLTMSASNIQKQAENEFFKETKKVRSEVEKFTNELKKGKSKFDEKRFNDVTNQFTTVGREQLADYIGYRQTIIDMLLKIYDETINKNYSVDEKDIHSLFMPMGKNSLTTTFYSNNIWIFDDKFMSYSYSASDVTISKIVNDVEGIDTKDVPIEYRSKKPDLVMFYSDPENEYKDVLLIEFKKLDGTIDDKEKAINQINRYPRYIDDNIKNIRSIFTYTILDIDKELRDGLTKEHGFVENAFGNNENNVCAYYRYNPAVKAHINVVSFKQVVEDANKRNKVFLDILKENFIKGDNGE